MSGLRLEPVGGALTCPPGLLTTVNASAHQRTGHWLTDNIRLQGTPSGMTGSALFVLTHMLKNRKKAEDTEISWFEELDNVHTLELCQDLPAAMPNAVQDIDVKVRPFSLHENMILYNSCTGESMKLLCTPQFPAMSGHDMNHVQPATIKVQRGFMGTGALAHPNAVGSTLAVAGSSFGEGSCTPGMVRGSPYANSNSIHSVKKCYGQTGTQKRIKNRTGDRLKQDKARAMRMLHREMDRLLLLSKQSLTVDEDGMPERTMDGIFHLLMRLGQDRIVQFDPNGVVGYSQLEEVLDGVFKYDNGTRVALADETFLRNLNKMFRAEAGNEWMSMGTGELFGMFVTRLKTPRGEFNFIHWPTLDELGGMWKGSAIILNMKDLVPYDLMPLTHDEVVNRKTHNRGCDREKNCWMWEGTLALYNPWNHMIIMGLCNVGKDCFECSEDVPMQTPHVDRVEPPCELPIALPAGTPEVECPTCEVPRADPPCPTEVHCSPYKLSECSGCSICGSEDGNCGCDDDEPETGGEEPCDETETGGETPVPGKSLGGVVEG